MKNSEVFKTTDERIKAFDSFCGYIKDPKLMNCARCKICPMTPTESFDAHHCILHWLDLDYSERLEPCPYCGCEDVTVIFRHDVSWVRCPKCAAGSKPCKSEYEAVLEYNRVAHCVKQSREKEG